MDAKSLVFKELTRETWKDFEALFGERGACGGCWCMWWRLKRSEFNRQKGAGNKAAMKKLVQKGETLGLLAYVDGAAAGWCAVAPRESYPVLENSRVLARVDDKRVWSITCFFVAKPFRKQGMSERLIGGALEFCRSRKAKRVEAYPAIPFRDKIPDAFAYMGLPSAFLKAGFREVERRSRTRPILRRGIR